MRFSKSGAFIGGVVVTLVIGTGTAVATNGLSLLIGKSNVGTATTGLSNSKGTPLSLAAKAGTPALKVNNTVKVKNLDADLLDGKDSTAFLPKGGMAANSSHLDGKPASAYLNTVYVASTNVEATPSVAPLIRAGAAFDQINLPAGTYLVTFAGNLANTDTTPGNFGCLLMWGSGGPLSWGFYATASLNAAAPGDFTSGSTTVSQVVTLPATGLVQMACFVSSGDTAHTSYVYDSTLTAMPIQTLHGVAASSVHGSLPLRGTKSVKR